MFENIILLFKMKKLRLKKLRLKKKVISTSALRPIRFSKIDFEEEKTHAHKRVKSAPEIRSA